jgi:hypothetical protein
LETKIGRDYKPFKNPNTEINIHKQLISQNLRNTNSIENKFEFKLTNTDQILKIIKQLKNKTIGCDNIRAKDINMIKYHIVYLLVREINKSLEMGYYPEPLNIIIIIPAYKSGEKTKYH